MTSLNQGLSSLGWKTLGTRLPRNKHKQWEIAKSIHFCLPISLRSIIVKNGTLCKALPFSESLLLLHGKTIQESGILLNKKAISLCACFAREWNTEGTSQSKSDPFFCILVNAPKKRPTSLLWKRKTSEGKIQSQKLFRQGNQGSRERFFFYVKAILGVGVI